MLTISQSPTMLLGGTIVNNDNVEAVDSPEPTVAPKTDHLNIDTNIANFERLLVSAGHTGTSSDLEMTVVLQWIVVMLMLVIIVKFILIITWRLYCTVVKLESIP